MHLKKCVVYVEREKVRFFGNTVYTVNMHISFFLYLTFKIFSRVTNENIFPFFVEVIFFFWIPILEVFQLVLCYA